MATIEKTIYVHANKWEISNDWEEDGEEWYMNLSDEAKLNLAYVGYEVAVKIEIDTETGEFKEIGLA